MSLTFYYSPHSSAVTVHWALEELGVAYEKVRLDLKAKDQKKPAFLAINPNGKVPALVHDGTALFESGAIMIHLGETFGVEKGLFPAPGPERALAQSWLVWCNASLNEALSRYMHSTSDMFPAEGHNAKAGAVAKADAEAHLAVLDKALTGKTAVVGKKFSLVDLHLSGWVGYAAMLGFDVKQWPAVDAWLKGCSARPAHATAMAA